MSFRTRFSEVGSEDPSFRMILKLLVITVYHCGNEIRNFYFFLSFIFIGKSDIQKRGETEKDLASADSLLK